MILALGAPAKGGGHQIRRNPHFSGQLHTVALPLKISSTHMPMRRFRSARNGNHKLQTGFVFPPLVQQCCWFPPCSSFSVVIKSPNTRQEPAAQWSLSERGASHCEGEIGGRGFKQGTRGAAPALLGSLRCEHVGNIPQQESHCSLRCPQK